ncbi:galactitol-1-phosphate 5-dehydrogenase [Clostridium beijerinckii]|uniref:Galactitol-1-phosphate 5-dehydrogenase n=1 Tax=Clostridium beijerinckii TaxID=1520 RepID=A0A0B5QV15_CLOBE|nr:galactitol-1-phosphate 5-dehydrogenase [Clostridium beijerinckii]AJH01813.2 galactitol-1-phosphate 5-dehydrogenase [Clostridium beijerinckii]
MKALIIEDVKKLLYKDIEIPKVEKDKVLIKVKACGICGSDVPRARDGAVHSFPQVVGHEFSGDIVEIGSEVEGYKVGDRVTAAPLIPCRKCENCEKGKPAMCTNYSFIGSREQGAMAEYVAVPSRNLIKLADNVTYEQGACIEPITVALHGVERVNIISGKKAIVYGCGTIGILLMQCLKAKGIEKIYVIDIDDFKLSIAKELGAYEVINPLKIGVKEYFYKHGKVDYVFETAGVNFIQSEVLNLVDRLGSVVYVGTAHKDVIIDYKTFENILRGELNVTGSWMSYSAPFPGSEWKAAVEYLESGKINVDKIITHRFKLEDGYRAFEAMLSKEENSIKVMYIV